MSNTNTVIGSQVTQKVKKPNYEIAKLSPKTFGYLYDINGKCITSNLSKQKKLNDNVYVAKLIGTHIELIKLNLTHTQFQVVSYIVKTEASNLDDKEECRWIVHTANNNAKNRGMSIYDLLMTSFSSVESKINSRLKPFSNIKNKDNLAREAVIDAFLNPDPTGNAMFWDGKDFLLKGEAHNKFNEYNELTIEKSIYDTYLSKSKLSKFAKIFPAPPLKDKFWKANGHPIKVVFYSIVAVATKGQTIFWVIYRTQK
jgi:hypothetical protein